MRTITVTIALALAIIATACTEPPPDQPATSAAHFDFPTLPPLPDGGPVLTVETEAQAIGAWRAATGCRVTPQEWWSMGDKDYLAFSNETQGLAPRWTVASWCSNRSAGPAENGTTCSICCTLVRDCIEEVCWPTVACNTVWSCFFGDDRDDWPPP